jgi:cytochrome c-type biogenesis protein CcmH/NrfG
MISSKSGINLLFACIVILLGVTAATVLYNNSRQPGSRPVTPPEPASSQLPQNQAADTTAMQLAELKQLAAKDPQNPEYLTQIGNLYYDVNQYANAIEYYRRSLAIHPYDPNVETDLATSYHYLGQDDKALEVLDNVLKYSPGFSQAMFNKGTVLIEGKKNVKDGIAVWEELLRAQPNLPNRAELEQKVKQLKGSVK